MPQQTPNVFTYPRTEPGTQGHIDLVEPLRVLPREVAETLRGASEAELRFKPASEGPPAEGWCMLEIAGHLRDTCEVDHKRLYLMSTQTDPILEPYDPDEYAREHRYMERSIDELLREMAEFRAMTVRLLTTLVNWNWARTGQHLESGRMSIRQLVEYMIEHEAEHLADLRRLRAAAAEANE